MRRFLIAAFAICALFLPTASQPQSHATHVVVPLHTMSAQGTGTWIERVRGDPTVSDSPFVFRIHNEAGYVVLPHVHPTDENIVVVHGHWSLGMGDRFDAAVLEPLEVGAYGFVARRMAHFALSKTQTIIQVHGVGPFVSALVDSIYELTDTAVLVKHSLLEPGRRTNSAPPECFVLKLGTRVRGALGEGTVVGAQCSPPNRFTQYRVRRSDGQNFWATRVDVRSR